MAATERIPLQRTVAVVTADSISVRPSRGQAIGPLVQAGFAAAALGVLIAFFAVLPLWLMVVLLLVAVLFGPVAVLGLVYQVYGASFLVERKKRSARWQQGFLGLGLGTTELMPFDRISYVALDCDADDVLSSGQEQDFVRFDVRLVKDNGRVLDVASITVARALGEEAHERAHALAAHLAAMTGHELRSTGWTAPESATVVAAEPSSRRRRRSRRRSAPPREA